jgi:hypothetical protein
MIDEQRITLRCDDASILKPFETYFPSGSLNPKIRKHIQKNVFANSEKKIAGSHIGILAAFVMDNLYMDL